MFWNSFQEQGQLLLHLQIRSTSIELKKIYEDRKDEFKYLVENDDGSICAKLPKKWIKINPGSKPDPNKPKKQMSEEQKEKLLAGLQKYREQNKK